MEFIIYYIKNTLANTWFWKAFSGAVFAVFGSFLQGETLLSLQFVFVCWLLIMVVGMVAGSKTEGFRFEKLLRGLYRLVGYYILCLLAFSADRTFGSSWVFLAFYGAIIMDMMKSFLKHSQVLGLGVPSKINEYVDILQKKIDIFFGSKIPVEEKKDCCKSDEI